MKVLILGAKGMLGSELGRLLHGQEVFLYDYENVDITDSLALEKCFDEIKPEIVFNCAAYNNVDKAEEEPDKARALNSDAVGFIAENCNKYGATLVQYSTGFVFDGENEKGYNEDAIPNPQSVYATTKFEGEKNAAKARKHYIIRLNLLFGDAGQSESAKKSFPDMILDLAKTEKEFNFVNDEISTPTYAKDLAQSSIKLVQSKAPYGIYHLPNDGRASWYDFAKEIFAIKNIEAKINAVSAKDFQRPAKRPHYSVLNNTKLPKQRSWQEALKEYLSNA